ncbi:putative quinol monooxygenase [Pelobacter seleniigenes]|uniref:putative quinol monooxygenase n=1 Tax=Pelobacter seleniigenes TaxID=407188 RepID=UPI0006899EB1|nr:putative quinol monooxygenase [Pelobacter seleniigenes]
MIDVTIRMKVPADKRNEVLQAISDLLAPIRNEQDCLSCHCYLDVEAEDVVIFEQEWKTNEALATHLRSAHFKVLLGAMKLLLIEPEIKFNTIVAMEEGKTLAAFKTGGLAGL